MAKSVLNADWSVFRPCCSTRAIAQAGGSRKSMNGIQPRPAVAVTHHRDSQYSRGATSPSCRRNPRISRSQRGSRRLRAGRTSQPHSGLPRLNPHLEF
jgi:hypothetical protein